MRDRPQPLPCSRNAALSGIIRAIGASALLLSLVAGLPLLLTATVGNPLSAWDALRAGDLSDAVVLGVLATVAYIAWAQFAIAVLVELVAAASRCPSPRPLPGVLSAQQHLAHTLVAAALLTGPLVGPLVGPLLGPAATTSTSTFSLTPPPAMPAATDLHARAVASRDATLTAPDVAPSPLPSSDRGGLSETTSRRASSRVDSTDDQRLDDDGTHGGHRLVTIGADAVPRTYWDLAALYLGDGRCWRQIAELNHGRRQKDGSTTASGLLRTGWSVIIPVGAAAETSTGAARHRAAEADHDVAERNFLQHMAVERAAVERVIVESGDTLSGIAAAQGVGEGWPRLWEMNRGRAQPHQQRFTDPDHIEPGWRVDVPTETRENHRRPGGASEHGDKSGTGKSTGPDPRMPNPDETRRPQREDRLPPAPAPGDMPQHQTHPDTAPEAPAESNEHPQGRQREQPGVTIGDGWVGLPLAAALAAAATLLWRRRRRRFTPGPLTFDELASRDLDLKPLPPAVIDARRAVRNQAPELLDPAPVAPVPAQPTIAEYAACDHELPLPPPGPSGVDLAGLGPLVTDTGLGLSGPGAEAAARALMVATLSSGSSDDPDAESQLIIPADTLTTLLGTEAVQSIGSIPRLTVTATLSEALTLVEATIVERGRTLQEYEAADLTPLHERQAYPAPMLPVLLLATTPSADHTSRLATAVQLGAPMRISTVLVGRWSRGDTLTLDRHGRRVHDPGSRPTALEHSAAGSADPRLSRLNSEPGREPARGATEDDANGGGIADAHRHGGDTLADRRADLRVSTLDAATTIELLSMLRETQPGDAPPDRDADPTKPPPSTPPSQPPAGISSLSPGPDADSKSPADDPDPSSDLRLPAATQTGSPDTGHPRTGPRVTISLLGRPAVLDQTGERVPGLRLHATELLVYLAMNRAGTSRSHLMEMLWPTATVRRAEERLSTELANVRRTIRRAAGDNTVQPVLNTGGHYRLNTDLLNIDVWTLTDALHQAAAADPSTATGWKNREAALRCAVAAHTGTLADGLDFEWIDPAREHFRRQGIRARVHLAEHLIHRPGPVSTKDPTDDAQHHTDVDPTRRHGAAAKDHTNDHVAPGDGRRAAAADRHAAGGGRDALLESVALLAAAADLDPTNEAVARRHMHALARIGDTAGVHAELQRLRRALDELGEEPSNETLELAARLRQDPPMNTEQSDDLAPPCPADLT